MNVGFLSALNYHSRTTFSGIVYAMRHALAARPELTVSDLGPEPRGLAGRIGRKLGLSLDAFNLAHALGRQRYKAHVRARLEATRPDVLFAPVASQELYVIDSGLPLVYASDATFRLLASTYDLQLEPADAEFRERAELAAVMRASRLLYSSHWAARSAAEDYGVDPRRIDVAPFGANFLEPPARDGLLSRAPSRDLLRLLFVGRSYERKGGALALEALEALRAAGWQAELTMIGCVPPSPAAGVSAIEYLNKDDPHQDAQLRDLYRSSHVFLFPTRADCSPISLCEASAYGLLILASDVGGVADLVPHEACLLPRDARGEAYARRLVELLEEPGRYTELCRAARERFEQTLNWEAWAEQASRSLQRALEG